MAAAAGTGAAMKASAARKPARKKSPFEQGQSSTTKKVGLKGAKTSSSSSSSSVRTAYGAMAEKKKVLVTKDKKGELRAVEAKRKEKDAKLKALSNRIAWLKAEEERASSKVSELNDLINVAGSKTGAGERDPQELSRDVRFRGILSKKGKEDVHRSRQRVKAAKKEHTKTVKALKRDRRRAERVERTEATEAKEEVVEEAGPAVHRIPVPSSGQGGEDGAAPAPEERLDPGERVRRRLGAEKAEEEERVKGSLTALELISRRWRDDKEPLRENMEITRRHILSQSRKRAEEGGAACWGRAVSVVEYGGGAWRKPAAAAS